ncbi:CbrC family protein [Streptomyces sp. S6]
MTASSRRSLRSLLVTDEFPYFRYHPDRMATGSVVASDAACVCCGRERGYVYTGPVYAAEQPGGRLCPWCIADGTAAARYEAQFCGDVVGGDVSREVLMAIAERTPGFTGWRDEQWLLHCADGAAFLGRAGATELAAHPDRREISYWGWPPDQIDHFLDSLDKAGQPTAYLFRCRVCAIYLAYMDFT